MIYGWEWATDTLYIIQMDLVYKKKNCTQIWTMEARLTELWFVVPYTENVNEKPRFE